MGMLGEANQVLNPLMHFIDHETYANFVVGRFLISTYPSLYRAHKLTFPQDNGGLACDSNIDKEMGIGSMSQAVGVSTQYLSILHRDYLSFSAYFDSHSRGVTWLINKCLISTVILVLSDPMGRRYILDVTIKDRCFI